VRQARQRDQRRQSVPSPSRERESRLRALCVIGRRELVVTPSHVASQDLGDVREMIRLAQLNGFDAVAVAVILDSSEDSNRSEFPPF